MKKSFIFCALTAIFALCMTIFGCSNSVDDMVEEYNGNFKVKISEKALPNVNSSDFSQTELIPYETYIIETNCNLKIYAPAGGKTYAWKMECKTDKNQILSFKNNSTEERAFEIYVEAGSDLYKPYILSVEVVNQNDVLLKDFAEVWILPGN